MTVLEVAVGIVVVILTIGLVLAVVPTATCISTRSLRAKNTVNSVVVAMNAYYTEYGEFPALPIDSATRGAKDDNWVGDPAFGAKMHNNGLMFVLRAIPKGPNADHRINHHKVSYFGYKSASLTEHARPRDGFFEARDGETVAPPEFEGCLYDPWGNEYGMIMDSSGDHRLNFTGIYADFVGDRAPKKMAGAFSTGKDRAPGHKGDRTYRRNSDVSDDVVSWE